MTATSANPQINVPRISTDPSKPAALARNASPHRIHLHQHPVRKRVQESVMRPYWKGYLKLALVSCPVALHAACSEAGS